MAEKLTKLEAEAKEDDLNLTAVDGQDTVGDVTENFLNDIHFLLWKNIGSRDEARDNAVKEMERNTSDQSSSDNCLNLRDLHFDMSPYIVRDVPFTSTPGIQPFFFLFVHAKWLL